MSVDDLAFRGNVAARELARPADSVRVFWSALAWHDDDIAAAAAVLSSAETARAQRFGTPTLRARYVAGRATLRLLLGELLGIDAVDVPIGRGHRGRPYVDLERAPDFNVSHTRDAAIFGFSWGGRIGVDLERRDRIVDAARLARKFCSDAERRFMEGLGIDAARECFLQLWTCKEAMSKATGDGLAAPMGRIAVATEGGLRVVDGPAPYDAPAWRLLPVATPPSHFGTVALWRPPDT